MYNRYISSRHSDQTANPGGHTIRRSERRRKPGHSALLTACLGAALALAVPAVEAGWNPLAADTPTSSGPTSEIGATIAAFHERDPGIKVFFDNAHGYAVFPSVGKLGVGIGGAYGEGEVYAEGRHLGSAKLTQLTVGLQLGAQAYSEIVFFRDARSLQRFTDGGVELSAQASAVALDKGASASANYSDGMAVFTLARGGAMYEASVGGQKFFFTPHGE